MNNRDIFDRLRPLASRLSKSAGKKAPRRAGAAPESGGRAAQVKKAKARPVTKRELIYTGWSAAILLCMLLSAFAVLFASCSSAEQAPVENSEPVEDSAAPETGGESESPPLVVSPVV